MFLSVEILIDAPASNVFPWLNDFDRQLQWIPYLVSVEIIQETPTKIGTRFRQHYRINEKEFDVLGEITEYQQDKLIASDCYMKEYSMISVYRLQSKGYAQTLLTYETLIQYKGFVKLVSLILKPILKPLLTRQTKGSLSSLKEHCEAEYRAES